MHSNAAPAAAPKAAPQAPKAAPQGPVLVVHLGRMGDMALMLAAFQAIRRAHAPAPLVCLTGAPFEGFARACGAFDEVVADPLLRLNKRGGSRELAMLRGLARRGFSHVYDLHDRRRTRDYLALMRLMRLLPGSRAPAPEVFSTSRRGVSPLGPDGRHVHISEHLRRCLATAGVEAAAAPDLSALEAGASPRVAAEVEGRDFALLMPGAFGRRRGRAPERVRWPPTETKAWPARLFGEVAARLLERGVLPAVVGTAHDREAADAALARAPGALDLVGRTGFGDIVALSRRARAVLANDTGPAHLARLAGGRVVALFASHPPAARWVPPGHEVLEREPLAELPLEEVWAALERALRGAAA